MRDRIDGGSFPLYYPMVEEVAQSGVPFRVNPGFKPVSSINVTVLSIKHHYSHPVPGTPPTLCRVHLPPCWAVGTTPCWAVGTTPCWALRTHQCWALRTHQCWALCTREAMLGSMHQGGYAGLYTPREVYLAIYHPICTLGIPTSLGTPRIHHGQHPHCCTRGLRQRCTGGGPGL